MNNLPRISFGMIVFNGEPFVRYNLRALYPYAHEIILVEGAAPGAAALATPDGHSTDGTLETIWDFIEEEDPENKVILITNEGIWEGEKDQMSQAYAERATGDYLWQVDSDEFYMPEDIEKVGRILYRDPSIAAVSFKMLTFWGSMDYWVDSWYLRMGADIYHRLFKWEPGYKYVTHRPPTVVDEQGRNLREVNWLEGNTLQEKEGIFLYHYSLLFPKQVLEKSRYYTFEVGKGKSTSPEWVQDSFLTLKKPYRVHNVYKYPGWLSRYKGPHPPQDMAMWGDVLAGEIKIEVRNNTDAERLLNSMWYPIRREGYKLGFLFFHIWKRKLRPYIMKLTYRTKLGFPIRKLIKVINFTKARLKK
jgi:glycosyltransferase involved in cell wall biosynthesis